jgi:hypothetical protein
VPLYEPEQPEASIWQEVIGQLVESVFTKNVSGSQVLEPDAGEIPSDTVVDEYSITTVEPIPADKVFRQGSAV